MNISEMADLLMLNDRLTYVKRATHLCSSKHMLDHSKFFSVFVIVIIGSVISSCHDEDADHAEHCD